jgi:hypothetical protein
MSVGDRLEFMQNWDGKSTAVIYINPVDDLSHSSDGVKCLEACGFTRETNISGRGEDSGLGSLLT